MARLTKSEIEKRALEIADMVLEGKKTTEIAKHYGCSSQSYVSNIIERHLLFLDKDKYDLVKEKLNSNLRDKSGPSRATLEKTIAIADYIIENDCTFADAERALGISKNYASVLIEKHLPQHDSKKYLAVRNIIDSHKKPTGSRPAPKLPKDIELKFDKSKGDTEHNVRAVCNYIIKTHRPWKEVADHFGVTENYLKQFLIRCSKKFDNLYDLILDAKTIALKGYYTGEMCEDVTKLCGIGLGLEEWRKQTNELLVSNGYKISEYLLLNTAGLSGAATYFDTSVYRCKEALLVLKEVDYEKYKEVQNMLEKYHSRTTKSSVKEQPKDNVVQLNIPDTTPLSPTLVAEPVKVAAEVKEPIVKDTEAPVIQKVCDTKIEMVAKPVIEETAAPKVGFWQRIKNWFMGA